MGMMIVYMVPEMQSTWSPHVFGFEVWLQLFGQALGHRISHTSNYFSISMYGHLLLCISLLLKEQDAAKLVASLEKGKSKAVVVTWTTTVSVEPRKKGENMVKLYLKWAQILQVRLRIDEREQVRSEPYLSVFVTVVSPKRSFLG